MEPAPRAPERQIGEAVDVIRLPDSVTACLFDMDGVLTDTASLHAEAWKRSFDAFLREYQGVDAQPFDIEADYEQHVDGKPREDGVRDFLASRGIDLPEGSPDDPPEAATVTGVAKRKNVLVLALIDERGVDVYEGSVRFVKAAREAGMRTAVVSSSANTAHILEAAGMSDQFDARVDGVTLAEEKLRGKPAPDSFLRGAELVGVGPESAAVFEDAFAGVAGGRAGGFAVVVGVDRNGNPEALREHGADVVVSDLAELLA
jgi:beta-phosphoglucomutase family hydrolase